VSRRRYAAGERLNADFFAQRVEIVAPRLVGAILVHRDPEATVALRLVEVEAYLGVGRDEASHAHRGRTPRNRQMFATPGRLYVYLSYGVHHCLNVVCEPEGRAGAILLRAAQVLEGQDLVAGRRGLRGVGMANGPGKLGQALAADLGWNGRSLLRGATGLWPGTPPSRIQSSGRIGISRATGRRLRFFDPESACVSRARPAL
jgi:DNA-3-methyladenine glycosylase